MKKEIRKNCLMFLYAFVLSNIILTKEVYGYLDPSAMTYVIQIIAAICITAGTGIGIFFYKIKKIFKKKKEEKEEE